MRIITAPLHDRAVPVRYGSLHSDRHVVLQELLDVLRGLGSPTLDGYVAQAPLFADPGQRDPAAFEALLGALASTPAPSKDSARHFVERVFRRQDGQPDPLRYGG